MQKLLFPLALLLVTFTACGQSSNLDQFYKKFNTDDGNGSINPAFLLNMSGQGSDSSGWLHKITMVRFMTIDAAKTPAASQEWGELTRSLQADHFEEWMSVHKGKGDFRLMSKDRKDGQEEVVCVIVDKDGNGLFFHLRGRFTAADKEKIQSALQEHRDS